MKFLYLDKIKSHESSPKIINIFSEKEIKMMQQIYADLPESVFNKKKPRGCGCSGERFNFGGLP